MRPPSPRDDHARARRRRRALALAVATAGAALFLLLGHWADRAVDDDGADAGPASLRAAWGTIPTVDLYLVVFHPQFSEDKFQEWMRMKKATFRALDERLARTATYDAMFERNSGKARRARGQRGRYAKRTRQMEIATAMFVLSGGERYSRAATLWGLGSGGQVTNIMRRFIAAVNEIKDEEIRLPSTREEGARVEAGFRGIKGLPGCIGAVDGTHIEIPNPSAAVDGRPGHAGGKEYLCYKARYSVHLQAVVDHTGLFLDVQAGFPGSWNDKLVFGESELFEKLQPLLNDPDFPGRYLLGDGGYYLRPFLIIPFPHDTTDPAECIFNSYVASSRVVVENAFGRLKARFRCVRARAHAPRRALRVCTGRRVVVRAEHARPVRPTHRRTNHRRLRYLNCQLESTGELIVTCCVLHNFIQRHETAADDEDGADFARRPAFGQRDLRPERSDINDGPVPPPRDEDGDGSDGNGSAADMRRDLQGGRDTRQMLLDHCWALHLQRGTERTRLFLEWYAAILDEDANAGGADDGSDSDSGDDE